MKYLILFCSFALYTHTNVAAQSHSLDIEIMGRDKLLFDAGFNNCDLNAINEAVSEKFEFFHDQAGIMHTKSVFMGSIRDGICKLSYRPKRVLIQNSVDIYPLTKDGVIYGAIQNGIHQFYALENNNTEKLTSNARFSHLWTLENKRWKLSKALSFDHQQKPFTPKELMSDSKLSAIAKSHNIPAIGLSYIADGKVADQRVVGSLSNGNPAPLETVWNVASLTKPVTALVTLKLINDGKWSLDEPLSNYFIDEDLNHDSRALKLTTRMVLSHQTGFPNWRSSEKNNQLRFDFEPGTRYQYSGEGFEYLRKAMEKKFGLPLNTIAENVLFRPLHMRDTSFIWSADTELSPFAKWHKENGEEYPVEKNRQANAADNLLTTVSDYSKFLIHILNGAGLNKHLYDEFIKEQIRVNANKHFGLGWSVDEKINSADNFALVHSGEDNGVRTIAFLIPEKKAGLLIFTNSDNGTKVYENLLLHYLQKDGNGILKIEMQ